MANINSNKFSISVNRLETPPQIGSDGKSSQIVVYKGIQQLTPVSGTPTTGQYKISITTENCTARIKSDNCTVYIESISASTGRVIILVNVENIHTYTKYLTVEKVINENEVHEIKSNMSVIEQTADKIHWLVKSGTSASNMQLTSEAFDLITKNITLKADHIKLEGYTTINGGFSVSTSGNMSCTNATISGTITSSTITGTTINGSIFKSGTEYNPHKQNITGLQIQDDTIYSYGTKNNGIYAVTKISGGTINIGNGEDGAGLGWSTHVSSSDISLFRQGGDGYFYVGSTYAPGSGYSDTTTTIDTNTINIGSKSRTTAFKVDYNGHCEFGNNYFTRGTLTINQLSQGVVKGTQTYLSGTTISATTIYQNGVKVSGSDIVLKDNIKEYEDSALDIINQTKVYSFNRISANPDKTEIGFLAQQVPDIFVFDKGEFTAEELEGLTADEKQELLAKRTEEYKVTLEKRKLDEISNKVTSFYDLDSEQAKEQITQIMEEYENIEYEVPISTINQNNIIAIMFKAIQELKEEVDKLKGDK